MFTWWFWGRGSAGSSRLAEDLADEVDVTLIDQSDSFVFGFAKLDLMFGKRSSQEVRLYYRDIAKPNVQFRQETVRAIDPQARRVVTDEGQYEADVLVVALGADLDVSATPGLAAGGHESYSVAGAERVREVRPSFDAGVAVIGVLSPVFKCPPAPNEAALMLHNYLVQRGARDDVTIRLISPLPSPIPVSQETSAAIVDLLAEATIQCSPSSRVARLDPAAKVAHLADGGAVSYDLFLGVPVHRAPAVVVESGLTEEGWVPVGPTTFATRLPGVYAIGDVTNAPVPRPGTIAEGEAGTLADVLVAKNNGGASSAYGGDAVCYMETGGGTVAKVDVNFLSGEKPTAVFQAPSTALAEEKREFGADRRRRWFGASTG